MPRFTLVFYETIRLTTTVEAAHVQAAIAKGEEDGIMDGASEETLGTDGLAEICDEKGEVVYRADDGVEFTQKSDEELFGEAKVLLEKLYNPKDYPEGK